MPQQERNPYHEFTLRQPFTKKGHSLGGTPSRRWPLGVKMTKGTDDAILAALPRKNFKKAFSAIAKKPFVNYGATVEKDRPDSSKQLT